ncbi:hypothetical protein D046_3088A, partial [Vibrio parahaemolyticus V-223/04]
MFFNPKRQ